MADFSGEAAFQDSLQGGSSAFVLAEPVTGSVGAKSL